MNWTRTFEVLSCQAQLYPQAEALRSRNGGAWTAYSTEACQEEVDRYSQLLWQLGVRKGDRVMMVPNLATAAWLFLDLGIQQLGAISVPCHATNQPGQFALIQEETEARICFFSNQTLQQKFLPQLPESTDLQVIWLAGEEAATHSIAHQFSRLDSAEAIDLPALRAAVQPTDLSAILYTSGTTGRPKGVMLTHANIVSNIKSALPLLPLEPGKRALSFLPFSHIFERTTLYSYLASGINLCLTEERDHLLTAFQEVKPHFFTAVPRILEAMYDRVLEFQARQAWWLRRVISWALKLGENYREQAKVRPWYWVQKQLAQLLVFNRFRDISGGKVEAIFTGAAYLRPEIGRIFSAAGTKVREGYGMTETSPIIAMNQFLPGLNRFGTVGVPIPGVEVKIDEPNEAGEGEIIVRGPNVMQGYYRQPEETAKVLDESGWLRTGDIGTFVHRRFLKITDRKKDIFKTSSGKYIAPLVLENHLLHSHFINQAMVLGFQQPHVAALVHPNFELLQLWCQDEGIHWTSPPYMVHNLKVQKKLQEEVDMLNESLPSHEKVRAFHLFHEPWTIEGGELTYTMKLVRPKITELFAKPIRELYSK